MSKWKLFSSIVDIHLWLINYFIYSFSISILILQTYWYFSAIFVLNYVLGHLWYFVQQFFFNFPRCKLNFLILNFAIHNKIANQLQNKSYTVYQMWVFPKNHVIHILLLTDILWFGYGQLTCRLVFENISNVWLVTIVNMSQIFAMHWVQTPLWYLQPIFLRFQVI